MIENTGSVLPAPARSGRKLRRGVGVGLTGALALAGLGLATGVASAAGSAGPSQARADGTQASSVHAAAAARVRTCTGGVAKRTQTVGSNTPTIFSSSTVSLLPTPLVVAGPSRGSDTLLLTWSSETQLRGNAKNTQFDWIEGIITVDGVPVTDVGGDQLALSGAPFYASNATQACVKIGKGSHRIQLQARVVSNSGQAETGWLDDWELRADVLD